jgi:hypothetical protein
MPRGGHTSQLVGLISRLNAALVDGDLETARALGQQLAEEVAADDTERRKRTTHTPPAPATTSPSTSARCALPATTDSARLSAAARRGLGDSPAEVTFLATLRGAMGRARRFGTATFQGRPHTYANLHAIHSGYLAAKAEAKDRRNGVHSTPSPPGRSP